jgi:hypothetical protein
MNAAPVFPTIDQFGTPKSGIGFLRNAVKQYFSDFSIPAQVAPVGLKYRTFQLNQNQSTNANRIVFIPGEFDGSLAPKPRAYGTLNRATRNSASVVNPRELLSWERPMTISIWAAPTPGKANEEDDAIMIVEDLLEQVVRAIQGSQQGAIKWGDVTITSPPNENSFGAELLVSLVQIGPIYDITLPYVTGTPALTRSMTP